MSVMAKKIAANGKHLTDLTVFGYPVPVETIRKFLIGLMCLGIILSFFGVSTAWATEQSDSRTAHLYDEAGLFSDTEKSEIEQAMKQAVSQTGMDFVVVTTADAKGMSVEQYGEQFYIDGNFGFDDEYSGMIFLIDMDNREIFYTPIGKMNYYITDERRDEILDDAFSYVADGEYAKAANLSVTSTLEYYQSGMDYKVYPELHPDYGKKSLTLTEMLIAVLAAAGIAFLPCVGIVVQYTRKKNQREASGFQSAYRTQSHFVLSSKRDHFINKTVTSVRIPKNPPPSSGGGSSSGGYRGSNSHSNSGRSFNGGSRKF